MALFVKNPKAGDWDYDGGYIPGTAHIGRYETFSIGVFRWVSKKSGKGIKRSPVIKRFHGFTSNPELVYRNAKEYIEIYLINQIYKL
jgi:hypothetical protein